MRHTSIVLGELLGHYDMEVEICTCKFHL